MKNIKTILVPSDLTGAAKNALGYTIVFPNWTNAKIIILHIYHIPLVSDRTHYVSHPGLVKENLIFAEQQLKNLEFKIPALRNIDYETKTVPMYWSMEIPEIIQMQNADLTVTGTNGASGLKEIILGSITASMIETIKHPLLAIPEQADHKEIKHTGFAFDQALIEDNTKLDSLVTMAKMFNAVIHTFHVNDSAHDPGGAEQSLKTATLNSNFGTINHTYSEVYGYNIEKSINKYIEEKNIDTFVRIPGRHNVLQRVFKGRLTNKMAFYIKTPLLAITE